MGLFYYWMGRQGEREASAVQPVDGKSLGLAMVDAFKRVP
jgi:hypothetical protein